MLEHVTSNLTQVAFQSKYIAPFVSIAGSLLTIANVAVTV